MVNGTLVKRHGGIKPANARPVLPESNYASDVAGTVTATAQAALR